MPNPRLLKTATRLTEKGFKIKNRLLAPYTTKKGDITLYLLKTAGGSSGKKFKLLATIPNFGMDVETTMFRSRPYLEIAKSEKTFGENSDKPLGVIIGFASYIAVVPNGEIYSIREADEVQMQQTDYTYKIFAQLTGQKFDLSTDV